MIGLSYRAEIKAHLAAPFLVTIQEIELGPHARRHPLRAAQRCGALLQPGIVPSGAYTGERLTVDVDVSWYDYLSFPRPSAATPTFEGGLAGLILLFRVFLPIAPPARDIAVPSLGVGMARGFGCGSRSLRAGQGMQRHAPSRPRPHELPGHRGCHRPGLRFHSFKAIESLRAEAAYDRRLLMQIHVLETASHREDDLGLSPYGDLRIGGLGVGGGYPGDGAILMLSRNLARSTARRVRAARRAGLEAVAAAAAFVALTGCGYLAEKARRAAASGEHPASRRNRSLGRARRGLRG
ncbi:MAG: hypothetical protein U0610_04335 [bacterium]